MMTSPSIQNKINNFYDHFIQIGINASSDKWVTNILTPKLNQQSTARTILNFVYNFCFEGTIPEAVDLEGTLINLQKEIEGLGLSSLDFANKAQFVAGVLTQLKKKNDPEFKLLKRINTVAQELALKDRTDIITPDTLYLADKIFEERPLQNHEGDDHKSAFVRASDDQRECFQKTLKAYLVGDITMHRQELIDALEMSAASFEAQSPINYAVNDIMISILQMLDPKSLTLIAQTCKRFKMLSSSDEVIFKLVKTHFPGLWLSTDHSKEHIVSLFQDTSRKNTLTKNAEEAQKIPIVSEILLGRQKDNSSFRVSLLTETASFLIAISIAHKLLIWIDKSSLEHRCTATMPEGSFLNSAYAEGDTLHTLSNEGSYFTWNITDEGVTRGCIEDFGQHLSDTSQTTFYFAPNTDAHRPRMITDNGTKLSCFDVKKNNTTTTLEEVAIPISHVTKSIVDRSRTIPHRLRVNTHSYFSDDDYSIFDLFSGQELISISSSEKYIGDTGKIFVTQQFTSRVIRLYDMEHGAKEPFMEFDGLSLNISSFLIQDGIFYGLLYESESGGMERDFSSLSYKKLAAFWDLKTGKCISTLDLTDALNNVALDAAKFFALGDCIYLIRASGNEKLIIQQFAGKNPI
jgi:hypothetical protein